MLENHLVTDFDHERSAPELDQRESLMTAEVPDGMC